MKTQWVWMFLWSNAMDFWNFAYEANNGFKKQCNWFGGMLIDNTIDLKLCLWSNAINLEQFLWNAMNLEICLDVDSIVELCLWINTIDFELCLQSNTMDFAAAKKKLRQLGDKFSSIEPIKRYGKSVVETLNNHCDSAKLFKNR